MKFKTTYRLFVIACVLIGSIWMINRRAPSDRDAEKGGKVVSMTFEEVRSLSLERGDFRLDCVKRDGKWFIEKPVLARADEGQIQRILNLVSIKKQK